MRPTISVIIPAINEEASIGLAIQSAQAAGANEVIVADGGSRDATVKIANAESARVTTGATGRAQQQNSGAALAICDFLLFQHADCRLSVECLRQIEAQTQQILTWFTVDFGNRLKHRAGYFAGSSPEMHGGVAGRDSPTAIKESLYVAMYSSKWAASLKSRSWKT